ncbi:MAG TPA: SGNH/GDSL hydrolase family protein [Planctomycetota bacterium]
MRLACVLGALALAGLATSLFLLRELAEARSGVVFFGEEALRDEDVRREVVRKLSAANLHPFDSHPDAEVARVLVADSQRDDFRTNAIGMRGPPFELEKLPGVVRIVLLGDSYVFGVNVAEEERLSEVLARELGARATDPGSRFECLNLAVNSWNLVAECAFLRRQVDSLRPDLVIQVTYPNDLDDVTGVRGFGAEARFAPRWPAHGDGLVFERHAQSFLGLGTSNLLPLALDHEGRTRFAEALAALQRLRAALGALPERAPHLLVVHWKAFAPAFHAHLGTQLAPSTLLYLPEEYGSDRDLWITPSDPHWNAAGHARVARLLYGVIRARGLLGVSLEPWDEADRAAVEESARGLAGAQADQERSARSVPRPLAALDFPEVELGEARQIYGGIDRDGLVSPYASCALWRSPAARTLRLTGASLPDRALAGARVRVHLEELELATLEIRPGTAFELELPLPAALQEREWLNLRFAADDHVYRGSDLRRTVVFRLERAALE